MDIEITTLIIIYMFTSTSLYRREMSFHDMKLFRNYLSIEEHEQIYNGMDQHDQDNISKLWTKSPYATY